MAAVQPFWVRFIPKFNGLFHQQYSIILQGFTKITLKICVILLTARKTNIRTESGNYITSLVVEVIISNVYDKRREKLVRRNYRC